MKHRYALPALFLPVTAFAQSPADAERFTAPARDFELASERSDMESSLNIMPPMLIDGIAAQMNVMRKEYPGPTKMGWPLSNAQEVRQ